MFWFCYVNKYWLLDLVLKLVFLTCGVLNGILGALVIGGKTIVVIDGILFVWGVVWVFETIELVFVAVVGIVAVK